MPHLAAFVAVAVVVIVTPGPDTALTIRNTLLGGRRGGMFTAVGAAAGQMIWSVATSAGVAALLVASEPVFRGVRYAGGAYLTFLGVQALRAAARRGGDSFGAPAAGAALELSPLVSLRQGLFSNLTNPKMVAFFPGLLPQFAPEGQGTFLVLLLLGLLFSTMTLVWLTGYAFAVVLVALGLRLATESR
jgi:threonine/homoserine/homoserine lactone efflux protein